MKIGIVCADEARFRRIARALKQGNFTKLMPKHRNASLDVVLSEGETAGPTNAHPCIFIRGSSGELAVQCGRHKEMQLRANAETPSRNTLTMIFQDNTEANDAAEPRTVQQARKPGDDVVQPPTDGK